MGGYGYVLVDMVTFSGPECAVEVGSNFDLNTESSTTYITRATADADVSFYPFDVVGNGVDGVAGIDGLEGFRTVKFAYLDSYDWPYDNMDPRVIEAQRAEYERRGSPYGKEASAAHHLELARAVNRRAANGCIIVFDDTWWPKGQTTAGGKGQSAIPFLAWNGWEFFAGHSEFKHNMSYVAMRLKEER